MKLVLEKNLDSDLKKKLFLAFIEHYAGKYNLDYDSILRTVESNDKTTTFILKTLEEI